MWFYQINIKLISSYFILEGMGQKKCQKLVMEFFWTPKTPFFV